MDEQDDAAIGRRIVALERELVALRQQQAAALLHTIAREVGPGIVFSARELLAHGRVSRALGAAWRARRLTQPQKLGKLLQRLQHGQVDGVRLLRVGDDRDGVLWTVEVGAHRHPPP